MEGNTTSIFEAALKDSYMNTGIGTYNKVYLPVNDAVEALLEMLNDKRKRYGKVKALITVKMFQSFSQFHSIIRNHVEVPYNGLSAFAFASSSYRVFSIGDENGVETVDGIEVLSKVPNKNWYAIGGLLMTDQQYKDLVYWAKEGISKKDGEFWSEEQIRNEISATSINIGTDVKVIQDLLYNYPQKRWRDFAEVEFGFYNSLREFLSKIEIYVFNQGLLAQYKKPSGTYHEWNSKANLEEILDMVMIQAKKLLVNLEKYKICYNEKEWIDGENIADIPFEEYIRLSNGACWAVENLIDHFQNVKGFNRPPNVEGYPTRTLFNKWEPDVDKEHLFNHPIAKERGLREWYEKRKELLQEYVKIISDRTMNTLKELLEVLASRGPAFVKALRTELQAQKEMPGALEALRKADGVISDTGRYKELITSTVNEILKSQASYNLVKYVNSLPKKEYNALNEFEPNLVPILTGCSEGRACVWYTADIVRNAYNDIAEVKGVEKIFTGKSKFDHVTPTKIEF